MAETCLVFSRRKYIRDLRESWPAIWKSCNLFGVLIVGFICLLLCEATCLGQGVSRSASPTKPGKDQTDSTAAQQAFAASCAGCHGLDGKGGERAPDIVTRPKIRQLSDAEVFEILQKGVPRTAMPSFSYLGDPALHSLVAHLRTLQGDLKPARLPGNAQQ